VVAKVARLFDEGDSTVNQVVWTRSGDYVMFLDDHPMRVPGASHQALIFVNTHTGKVGHLHCPDCASFAAVGDNDVLALINKAEKPNVLKFNLDSPGRGTPVTEPSSLRTVAWTEFLASTRGKVLVNASTLPTYQEVAQLYGADGSRSFDEGPFSDGYILAAAADRTIYGSPVIAATAATNPGICASEYYVTLFNLATSGRFDFNMSDLLPPRYITDARGGIEVQDLWWGLDGHLRATIQSWDCDNTKKDEQSKKVHPTPSTLWRLDGARWVQEDPSLETMVRQLDRSTKVVLVIPTCIDKPVQVDQVHLCNTGKLYNDHTGTRTLVADNVISISTPPSMSTPAVSGPLPTLSSSGDNG
jgi:hypothetical protein